jgi:Flp pilus assembly protein TadD
MTELEKGKALFAKQDFEGAIIVLSEFLTSNPDNADALYTRGISYRKIEKYDASINDLTAILKRLPEEATLLCDRGISHFKNKNIEAALKDMNKAVELEPENPFRYSSRAYIRTRSDVNGAIADYEKAVELDPKDEISYNNLGLLHENAGRMKAAKKNFKKSNEASGYDPDKRQEEINKEDKEAEKSEHINNLEVQENHDSLGKTMLSVFTSKTARQEYFHFVKSIFTKKS